MQTENSCHAQGNLQKLHLQFKWMGWKQRHIYPTCHHYTPTSLEELPEPAISTCESVVTFSLDRLWDVVWRRPISYYTLHSSSNWNYFWDSQFDWMAAYVENVAPRGDPHRRSVDAIKHISALIQIPLFHTWSKEEPVDLNIASGKMQLPSDNFLAINRVKVMMGNSNLTQPQDPLREEEKTQALTFQLQNPDFPL